MNRTGGTARSAVVVALVATLVLAALGGHARADDAAEDPARAAFREGAALIEQSEWASALTAFERSFALKPHGLTLYNMGVCQRFLGRYTLARETLKKALARGETSGEIPAMFVEQAKAYLAEIDAKLAHVTLIVTPPETRVAVEGRPLEPAAGQDGTFVAGIAEPGEPRAVGRAKFEVAIDPRSTVLTFSLPGYETIEVRRDPKPGSREEVPVSMTEQPAQVRVASNVARSAVRVDGVDVGVTPVVVTRPPGVRLVTVTSEGYEPYESKVTLKPGQFVPLDAQLAPESVPVTKRWWFWTGAAAVVVAAAVTVFVLTRPPAPYDGGNTGWVAQPH